MFEYKLVSTFNYDVQEQESTINKLICDGWELYQVASTVLYFRKPKGKDLINEFCD